MFVIKVGVYYNNKDVRVEERPIPKIGDKEFLVKVKASGICGSDVLEWYRIKKAPIVLGHEITGDIAEVGKAINGYKVGDRVFVSHHVPCNECYYCKNGHHTACDTLHKTNFDPGGFSEYIRIPEINVKTGTYHLPENVSFDEGTFIEPLGCVVRGQRLAGKAINVLIIGSGISGLLHIMLAKCNGAKNIFATDINNFRLDMARKYGANYVFSATEDVAKKIKDISGRLADLVIVCTGALSAAEQALRCVDKGGKILFFAVPNKDVPIPMIDFWRNEITILTSYGASPSDLESSLDLLKNKKIDVLHLITHRLPLERIQDGFDLVAEAKNSIKVIIQP